MAALPGSKFGALYYKGPVMFQFVIIPLIFNTCPNLLPQKYILSQFVIAALFCNNGCPNL